MKHTAVIMLLTGLALFTAILAWRGLGAIAAALDTAGWGLALVAAWHIVPLVMDSWAWRLLFARPRPALARMVWARWIGESINGLLPVAQVGGDIAKVRLLILRGLPAAGTGASVVVDTTLAAVTQMAFAVTGLLMLLALLHRPDLAWAVGVGILVMLTILGLFYRLQRSGLFAAIARALKRASGSREWLDFVGSAQALDECIEAIYVQPGLIVRVAAWRLAGWIVGIGEVWIALYFLGAPVTWSDALMLEALGQAIRGAAFIIPGALGVQEGGYVVLASLVGLTPDMGLALALARRVRELAFGLPGLVAWQWAEGRAFGRRAAATPTIRER